MADTKSRFCREPSYCCETIGHKENIRQTAITSCCIIDGIKTSVPLRIMPTPKIERLPATKFGLFGNPRFANGYAGSVAAIMFIRVRKPVPLVARDMSISDIPGGWVKRNSGEKARFSFQCDRPRLR